MRLAIIALSIPFTLNAATLDLTKTTNKVEFLAVGKPSALKIRGETKTEKVKTPLNGKLTITDSAVTGTATYHLDALDTGIELRNSHMKEKYLEIAKHPTSELKITELKLPAANAGKVKAEAIPFAGTLKLHGVEKPVKGTVTVDNSATEANLTFEFSLQTTDFAIDVPSYLGIKVTDAVKVTTKISGPIL
jgi:polyisoprenoid-binding protein YceI